MYTVIVTKKSGGTFSFTTDDVDLLFTCLSYYKNYTTARKLQVFYPNHQTKAVHTWDSKGKFWVKEEYT